MTVYVGTMFACPARVADRMGFPEGRRVCWLTADRESELWTFAADMPLPDARLMGSGPMAHYVITGLERNRALVLGAQEKVGAGVVR